MGVKLALAAFAVLLGAVGCDGRDPAPTPVPSSVSPSGSTAVPGTTSPATSSPAPTPTPTPPALPALARQDSPAGAEAFARFWLTTLDYASTTGDTKPLRQLANCPGCNALADGIDKLAADGGRTIGGKVTISRSDVAKHVVGQAALVDLTYSRAARTVEYASGKDQAIPPESNVRLLVTMRRERTWLITNVQPVK